MNNGRVNFEGIAGYCTFPNEFKLDLFKLGLKYEYYKEDSTKTEKIIIIDNPEGITLKEFLNTIEMLIVNDSHDSIVLENVYFEGNNSEGVPIYILQFGS